MLSVAREMRSLHLRRRYMLLLWRWRLLLWLWSLTRLTTPR